MKKVLKRLYTSFSRLALEKEEHEVLTVAREIIKPYFPTPNHLSHIQLSFLDQISSQIYIPRIFFYPPDGDINISNTERSKRLKRSLSHTLTWFYPLAGRLKDDFIECNDEGVHYVEARAKCKLMEIIKESDLAKLNMFLPCKLSNAGELLLAIQVNIFDCGGIAIGVCISHKMADAFSLAMFIRCWTAASRGDTDALVLPCFELAKLFPPKKLTSFKPATGTTKQKIVAKRFLFSASVIDALQAKYACSKSLEHPWHPTRVEALSALIWNQYVAAIQPAVDSERLYTVVQVVNMRKRIPMLLDNYFGNISQPARIIPSLDAKDGVYAMIAKMRHAIKNVNSDYATKIINQDEHSNFLIKSAENITNGNENPFVFSSLCRFPLYDADFGWGKPVWVTSATLTFKNLVIFMDTRAGDGIEAWINLKEDDMSKLEDDPEFHQLASPSSSIPVV